MFDFYNNDIGVSFNSNYCVIHYTLSLFQVCNINE